MRTTYFDVVNESFIQVKHEGVDILARLQGVQERRVDLRQVCEVVWEDCSAR